MGGVAGSDEWNEHRSSGCSPTRLRPHALVGGTPQQRLQQQRRRRRRQRQQQQHWLTCHFPIMCDSNPSALRYSGTIVSFVGRPYGFKGFSTPEAKP